MLVFTLKSNDVFHVGADIHVRIIKVKGANVKVGIEAPRELDVDRHKVRENKAIRRALDGSSRVGIDPA